MSIFACSALHLSKRGPKLSGYFSTSKLEELLVQCATRAGAAQPSLPQKLGRGNVPAPLIQDTHASFFYVSLQTNSPIRPSNLVLT